VCVCVADGVWRMACVGAECKSGSVVVGPGTEKRGSVTTTKKDSSGRPKEQKGAKTSECAGSRLSIEYPTQRSLEGRWGI
jgi:hypothetical protein